MTTKKTSKPKAKKVKTEGGAATALKAPRDQKNGITRPGDNKCGQVWAACDALKAEGKELTFEALRLALDTKIADATIRTQRQRWKTYNG